MKKIFAAAVIALLVMTSCSEENLNKDETNAVLIKKKIEQSADGSILTTSYLYDGTKLTDITYSNGNSIDFTYTGDLITKVENFENSVSALWTEFTYDAEGRVAETIDYGHDTVEGEEGEDPVTVLWANRTTYTYNGDGTVSLAMYTGDHDSQTEITGEGTLTLTNGNVTAYTSGSGNSTYTFDANNNPEINITGINALNIAWKYSGINNVISATHSDGTGAYTATYTYNSKNYPVSAVETEGEEVTNIWYTY